MSNKITKKHSKRARQHNGTWCGWTGNGIDDEGARGLGDALKTNTTLTLLNLSGARQDHKETQQEQGKHNGMRSDWADNKIGDEGARGLFDALKTNTTLTWLNLRGEQHDHKQAQQETRQAQRHEVWLGRQRDWC